MRVSQQLLRRLFSPFPSRPRRRWAASGGVEPLEVRLLLSAAPTLVRDIQPGTADSHPNTLAASGATLYFTADDGRVGRELWATNGTAAGTRLVADVVSGAIGSSPAHLTPAGGRLFFTTGSTSFGGAALWVTNGTAAGTARLAALPSGFDGSDPNALTAVGNSVYFLLNGKDLWTSNGTTTGTRLVREAVGGANARLSGLTAVGQALLFFSVDSTNAGVWRSNGTATGTLLLKQITLPPFTTGLAHPTVVGDRLFFTAGGGFGGDATLWVSQGTAASTVALKTVGRLLTTSPIAPPPFAARGTILFFGVETGPNGSPGGLWRSDGTAAGTFHVASLASREGPRNLTRVGSKLYFTDAQEQLWISDGSQNGTTLLGPGGAELTAAGSTLYFLRNVFNNSTRELWTSNGTSAGTRLVQSAPIRSAGFSAAPRLTAAGGLLFLAIDHATFGQELFVVVPPGTPNRPPLAHAGGPYFVDQAASVTLDGRRSSDPDPGDAIVRYQWDLNNEGLYDRTATVSTLNLTPALRQTFGLGVGSHTVRLRVADRAGRTATATALVTVQDGTPARLSIGNASVVEGNAGETAILSFIVRLDRAVATPVRVSWSTADGTARAREDYVAGSGTLHFAVGEMTKTVSVAVRGDAVVERDETVLVRLSNLVVAAEAATITRDVGIGVIRNDDTALLRIGDDRQHEGPANGSRLLNFVVTLDRPLDVALTINFTTANGTAQAGPDYIAASGRLTIAAGQRTGTISVTILGDTLVEPNETRFVRLSNLAAAGRSVTVGRAQGVGTILDGDIRRSTDHLFTPSLADSLLN